MARHATPEQRRQIRYMLDLPQLTNKHISEITGVSQATVLNHRRNYEKNGHTITKEYTRYNPRLKIGDAERQVILEFMFNHPDAMLKHVGAYLHAKLGLNCHDSCIGRQLKRLDWPTKKAEFLRTGIRVGLTGGLATYTSAGQATGAQVGSNAEGVSGGGEAVGGNGSVDPRLSEVGEAGGTPRTGGGSDGGSCGGSFDWSDGTSEADEAPGWKSHGGFDERPDETEARRQKGPEVPTTGLPSYGGFYSRSYNAEARGQEERPTMAPPLYGLVDSRPDGAEARGQEERPITGPPLYGRVNARPDKAEARRQESEMVPTTGRPVGPGRLVEVEASDYEDASGWDDEDEGEETRNSRVPTASWKDGVAPFQPGRVMPFGQS